MRRIVAFNRVSADGYFASSDGGLQWTVPEPELDKSAADNLRGQGTIMLGRKTYDMFESFWPAAAARARGGEAEDPHSPGRQSPELGAMARWIDDATKIVFSKTRKTVTWKNSRLLRDVEPRAIEALKREEGSDILLFGSGSIASQLTAHGLIDEYQFIVGPLLLGNGRPLITGVPKSVRLELAEAKAFAAGNVRLRYTLRG
jgi:dihydrofolate reductase